MIPVIGSLSPWPELLWSRADDGVIACRRSRVRTGVGIVDFSQIRGSRIHVGQNSAFIAVCCPTCFLLLAGQTLGAKLQSGQARYMSHRLRTIAVLHRSIRCPRQYGKAFSVFLYRQLAIGAGG